MKIRILTLNLNNAGHRRFHVNSLARRELTDLDWNSPQDDLDATPGDVLLAVHTSYLHPIQTLRAAGIAIHGLAHITGGGVVDNTPRILPEGMGVVLRRGTWPELPIFGLIQRLGSIPDDEMFHVFNMGLGMLVIVPPEQQAQAMELLHGQVYKVGEVVPGSRIVRIESGL